MERSNARHLRLLAQTQMPTSYWRSTRAIRMNLRHSYPVVISLDGRIDPFSGATKSAGTVAVSRHAICLRAIYIIHLIFFINDNSDLLFTKHRLDPFQE